MKDPGMHFRGLTIMFPRLVCLLATCWTFLGAVAWGQPLLSRSEDAQARIFIVQELLVNRIQDLDFGTILIGQPSAQVNPRTSPNAGKFVLHFDDTQEWTVRYQSTGALTLTHGGSGAPNLPFQASMVGHATDNQSAAIPLVSETGRYRTQSSLFFFWVGGEIETGGAVPGVFTGTFTLTVEAN